MQEIHKTIHRIAGEIERLERRLRENTQLGKHAAYVKAEFVEIEDALSKHAVALHEIANELP